MEVNVPQSLNEIFVHTAVPREKLQRTGWVRGSGYFQIDIRTTMIDEDKETPTLALLDSGCSKSSIDKFFVRKNKLKTRTIAKGIPVYNADGSINGHVNEYVDTTLETTDSEGTTHREKISLQVVNLGGKHDIFIGFDWLEKHNPIINWKSRHFAFERCPATCQIRQDGDLRSIQDYLEEVELTEDHGCLPQGESREQYIRAFQTTSTRIAAESHKDTKLEIPSHYKEFSDVFEKKEFDKLPDRRPWDHAINLKPGTEDDRRLKGKVYPMNATEQKELDAFLEENLRTGRIRKSQSPIAAPFFFVKKKDGSLRPVQDYRRVNTATVKDSWPLPLISDVLTKIKDAQHFSKFDVRWGFNNVRIKEGDEHKAAFICNRGLYEPLVMFFGLTNSPATFQHMMDDIFVDLVQQGVVIVYMDDILVFTKTLEEHRRVVKEVLRRLRQHRLYLKAEKCKFEVQEIDFLGLIIKNGTVAMDPIKTKAVREWPTPDNLKKTRSFMQFCNFYRSFIPNFATITVPFNDLTKKGASFEWGPRQIEAFDHLKKAISDKVTLMLPVPGARFRLETDASDYAVGAVLHQIIDGKATPLAFFSKTFQPAERNYQIYDKEMLAIMLALDNWRQFLRNGPEFDIWSDHQNLQYFREPQKLNRRQARWYTELADYDFKLHHQPGSLNYVADALSRKDQPEGGVEDNVDITLLKPSLFKTEINRLTFRDDQEILEEIRRKRQDIHFDEKVKTGLRTDKANYRETNGIIEYKGLVYVPRDSELRGRIIHAYHDTPIAGHPGRNATAHLITRDYWWPGLPGQVARYVKACEVCQRTKPRQGALAAPLHPNAPPSKPWEIITVDMIGPLPLSNGFDAILVIVDRLTKMVLAIPTNTTLTAFGTAQIFRDRVWSKFGIPLKVISDRGPQFVSNFITELYKMLHIEGNPSTAYHPQTDGQTERENAEIEKYLRAWVNTRQDDWSEWLALAEFAINNRVSTATKATPFELNYGRHPNMGIQPRRNSPNESASEFAERMNSTWKEAENSLKLAAETMKHQYDKHRKEARDYKVGDQVWLEATNLNLTPPGAMKKLSDKRVGPFKILKKTGPSSYKLQLPHGWKAINPVFNEALLTPYIPPAEPHQQKPPPPPAILVDGGEEYEVEEILDSRRRGAGVQYRVKWKGYGLEEASWEAPSNVRNAPLAVADFHRRYPNKPGKPPPRNK